MPRLLPLYALGGLWVGVAAMPMVTAFMMGGDNEYSLVTRLEAWHVLAEIVSISPLLGIGFANYYWYTPLFPVMGFSVKFNSHNTYLDIVAQTGLLGLCCFFWFCLALAVVGWRLRTRVPSGFARAYVYSALGGLGGTLVAGMLGDWVLPFVYNIGFNGFRTSVLAWIFLGGLVALQQHVSGSQIDETSDSPVTSREAW
jgi:O-antigen ligase